MKFESKFDIDEVVYVKTDDGVYMAKVCSIGIDMSQNQKDDKFRFIYLVWKSDRRNWAGHHTRVYEHNMGRTFEEAYYDCSPTFPWDIMDEVKRKDFKEFFKNRDVTSCVKN